MTKSTLAWHAIHPINWSDLDKVWGNDGSHHYDLENKNNDIDLPVDLMYNKCNKWCACHRSVRNSPSDFSRAQRQSAGGGDHQLQSCLHAGVQRLRLLPKTHQGHMAPEWTGSDLRRDLKRSDGKWRLDLSCPLLPGVHTWPTGQDQLCGRACQPQGAQGLWLGWGTEGTCYSWCLGWD